MGVFVYATNSPVDLAINLGSDRGGFLEGTLAGNASVS